MIDEKSLLKDLDNEIRLSIGNNTEVRKALSQIMDVIHRQPQVGGWIPVSERPPKETGNYLVTSKGSTWVANWFNGTWWGIEKKCRWTDVEAWQPLPGPYKEGKEE